MDTSKSFKSLSYLIKLLNMTLMRNFEVILGQELSDCAEFSSFGQCHIIVKYRLFHSLLAPKFLL
jgi:hypothetical protein